MIFQQIKLFNQFLFSDKIFKMSENSLSKKRKSAKTVATINLQNIEQECKEKALYEKLRKIYFNEELGEGNRRLYAYNLLIREWQSELTETFSRSEPVAERIQDDGSWKPTLEKKCFKNSTPCN